MNDCRDLLVMILNKKVYEVEIKQNTDSCDEVIILCLL